MTNNSMAPKKKVERKTKYTKQLGNIICERLASGEALGAICKDIGIHRNTVRLWRDANPDFDVQYARAREDYYDNLAEEMMIIANTKSEGHIHERGVDGQGQTWEKDKYYDAVEHRKLQIETRKWLLTKLSPKFKERVTQEVVGKDGGAIMVESKSEITSMSTEDLMAIAHLQVDEH